MRYTGGKSRIAGKIADYIPPGRLYIEPFLGGAAVYREVHSKFVKTLVADKHLDLCLMWSGLRDGWRPDNYCSEEEYHYLKTAESSAWRGLVGFGQSYGGKWFGGYARGTTNAGYRRNYLDETIRNNQKIAPFLQTIICADYRALEPPRDSVVYCDPPYRKTLGYSTGEFDHDEFWETVRGWKGSGALVIVSEYDAPEDFKPIAEFNIRQQTALPEQGRTVRTERLFA